MLAQALGGITPRPAGVAMLDGNARIGVAVDVENAGHGFVVIIRNSPGAGGNTTHHEPVSPGNSQQVCYLAGYRQGGAMSTMQAEVFEAFRSIDVASLKSDMNVMKWMMGFVLAFQVAIFVKMFVH